MQRNVITILSVALTLAVGYLIYDTLADFKSEMQRELAAQKSASSSTELQMLAVNLAALQKSVEELRRPVQIPANATGEYLIEAGVRNNQLELSRLSSRLEEARAGLIWDVSDTRQRLAELSGRLPELARGVDAASRQLAALKDEVAAATRVVQLEIDLAALNEKVSKSLEEVKAAAAQHDGQLATLSGAPMLASPEATVAALLEPLGSRVGTLEAGVSGLAERSATLEAEEGGLAGRVGQLESGLASTSKEQEALSARLGAGEVLLATHEGRLAGLEGAAQALSPLAALPLPVIAERWREFAKEEGGDSQAVQAWISAPLAKPTQAMIEEALKKSPYAGDSFLNQLRSRLLSNRADPATVDAGMAAFSKSMLAAAQSSLVSSTGTLDRLHAAGRLPTLGDKAARPVLAKLLLDESPVIRAQAALGAGILGDTGMMPQLLQVAERDDEDFVRCCAVVALGDLDSPEAIPLLREMKKKEKSREVRARALESLRILEEKHAAH